MTDGCGLCGSFIDDSSEAILMFNVDTQTYEYYCSGCVGEVMASLAEMDNEVLTTLHRDSFDREDDV